MKNVWVLSFECAGIVKVGGLGEAVYNIIKHLANRNFNVTLFMPNHGVHHNPETKKKLRLQKSSLVIKGKVKENTFLPYRIPFRYNIGILNGFLDGFEVVLFYGLDKATREILDDTAVYRADRIEDKALLLARGISGYVESLKELKEPLPDVIHAHDYHAIPAAVLAKQKLEGHNHKIALVLTVHLLSGKKVSWNYLGEEWCGIKNKLHPVYLCGKKFELSHRQLLKKARFKLESFGAMEAHALASVSQNYLNDEVMELVGSCCEGKTAFHWNGCDWNLNATLKENIVKFGKDIKSTLRVAEIRRYDLRKYLLTKALGNLEPEEPIIDEGEAKKTVWGLRDKPFLEKGKVEPFDEDGPMVLMTGRLTKQKGVDVLFKAIPKVLKRVPSAKFVLLLLPVEEETGLIKKFAKLTCRYHRSVRIIFGKAPSIYSLAHISSDVFACPSRWEPFGIMGLEAMATGNPVVATNVGGLKEIVVDIRQDLKSGTGMLVPNNDSDSLAESLSSLMLALLISEIIQKGKKESRTIEELTDLITHRVLREAVITQPSFGLKLREKAVRRVESAFHWNKVIDMVTETYKKAVNIASTL